MDSQPQAGIIIEQITSADILERCAGLFMNVFNDAPWDDEWTNEKAIALFTCYYHTPEFTGWAVFSNNKLIGCAVGNTEPHYTGKIFYLREMFVAAPMQKMGIGGRLMAAIKDDLELIGTKNIILFTQRSIFDYYTQFGFSEMEGMGMMSYRASN